MTRLFFFILLIAGLPLSISAAHIRGGELYYKYISPGRNANSSIYQVTLKLYIDCHQNEEGQLDPSITLNIFYKSNYQRYGAVVYVPWKQPDQFIRYDPRSNPCITNHPTDVCYRLRYYETTLELPNDPTGYIISFQRCCRIDGIRNMGARSNDFGSTYTAEIPGTSVLPDAVQNSSPVLNAHDAVAICAGTNFEYDFSAVDPDGDSLVYEFCEAFNGGGPQRGQNCLQCPVPIPGAPPPYRPIVYRAGFTATSPLGNRAGIDRHTGLVSGFAPNDIGQYVVTACVSEYRRDVLINTHRKDIHIKVSDCIPLNAILNPDYSFCDDLKVTFRNLQANPPGSVYTWDFGDGTTEQSTAADGTIEHDYRDAGTYQVKLRVVLSGQCIDEATTVAKVYPGFFPDFKFDGSCLFTPFEFEDNTDARYGTVNSWIWDFGDETTFNDRSFSSSSSWKYSSLGRKTVKLIVGSDRGCVDSIDKVIEVTEKPDLVLPFKDTLICFVDSLQLQAIGDGSFEWTPDENIIDRFTANPVVFPKKTTTYKVTMTEKLCVATDEVKVNVVEFVTLNAGRDTTICTTDSITLTPRSDGLRFNWTNSTQAYMSDPTAKNPVTVPLSNTDYYVHATIGSCFADDTLHVRTVPYPVVNAGPDKTICFDDTTILEGSTNGSSFGWQPASQISNRYSLRPSVFPRKTTIYSFFAYDTLGCPKPGIDRVLVTVRPDINAFAGNDTAVVAGQPLQLNGSGADFFNWSPATGLNAANIKNPVSILHNSISYIMHTSTPEGCFDLDTIHVQVFKTMPDIFVPNAFAPNGRNNELRPKAVGISSLDYFRIYNRWGQLVFHTNQLNKGWDGRINGVLQANSTYVWMVSGTDFTGKKVVKKGTAVLIR